ncbi:MAG: hypothetical protein CSA18_03230 [Deltaproteobacteria bacterium]|nr:MAG: hypothetical protein CSA18_03230 [Deltaproteobacteria bacterium]
MEESLLSLKKRYVGIVLCFFFFPLICSAQDMEKIGKKVSGSINKEIETQKLAEKWDSEKKDLKYQYGNLALIDEVLTERIKILKKRYANEEKIRDEFLRKQKEVVRIESELNSFLQGIIKKLEFFVKNDLPFHKEERLAKIDKVRDEILLEESSPGDKFRRVFELLKSEVNFGRTIEVYNTEIDLGNEEKNVDILRIGRVSLFFLSPDKKIGGKYNPHEKKWAEVSSKMKKDIDKGILVVKGERPAELVKLPFGRIKR